jgi:hypothetical protein
LSSSTATVGSIDSNLLSAIIAAVVAFTILFLDRIFIEPRKWTSRYEIRTLEKALEVHGWLLSVLNACEEKAKRQAEKRATPPSHLLESADILQLEGIFGKKAYLLSERLKQTWYDLQRKDAYFGMMKVRNRETIPLEPIVSRNPWPSPFVLTPRSMKHEIIDADLTDMQKQAEADFAALKSRYTKLTRFKPPTS